MTKRRDISSIDQNSQTKLYDLLLEKTKYFIASQSEEDQIKILKCLCGARGARLPVEHSYSDLKIALRQLCTSFDFEDNQNLDTYIENFVVDIAKDRMKFSNIHTYAPAFRLLQLQIRYTIEHPSILIQTDGDVLYNPTQTKSRFCLSPRWNAIHNLQTAISNCKTFAEVEETGAMSFAILEEIRERFSNTERSAINQILKYCTVDAFLTYNKLLDSADANYGKISDSNLNELNIAFDRAKSTLASPLTQKLLKLIWSPDARNGIILMTAKKNNNTMEELIQKLEQSLEIPENKIIIDDFDFLSKTTSAIDNPNRIFMQQQRQNTENKQKQGDEKTCTSNFETCKKP